MIFSLFSLTHILVLQLAVLLTLKIYMGIYSNWIWKLPSFFSSCCILHVTLCGCSLRQKNLKRLGSVLAVYSCLFLQRWIFSHLQKEERKRKHRRGIKSWTRRRIFSEPRDSFNKVLLVLYKFSFLVKKPQTPK